MQKGQSLTMYGFVLLIVVLALAALVTLGPAIAKMLQEIFPTITGALGG